MGFGDEIPKRGMGWQPHRNPVVKREAKKNKNQEAKRNLIPLQLLKTAAKRRRESEGEAECKAFCNRNGSYPKPCLYTTHSLSHKKDRSP